MVYRDWGEGYQGSLNEKCLTLGESLKAAGYATFVSESGMLLHTMTHLRIPFQKIVALIGRLLCERILIVIGRFWQAVTSTAMAKFLSKEITKKLISKILTGQIRISIRQISLRMLRLSTWKTISL